MPQSGVYAIRNTTNGKAYVGSAVVFRKRWSLHLSHLRRGTHHSPILQKAWDKYGEAAFEFVVLEVVADRADLLACEQRWIDAHRAQRRAYNASPTAGSRLGAQASPETRRKISASRQGQRIGAEARQKMREAALARSPEVAAKIAASRPKLEHTPETKARIAEKLRGIRRSPQTRAKIGAASKGRKHSDEAKAKRLASWKAAMAAKKAAQSAT